MVLWCSLCCCDAGCHTAASSYWAAKNTVFSCLPCTYALSTLSLYICLDFVLTLHWSWSWILTVNTWYFLWSRVSPESCRICLICFQALLSLALVCTWWVMHSIWPWPGSKVKTKVETNSSIFNILKLTSHSVLGRVDHQSHYTGLISSFSENIDVVSSIDILKHLDAWHNEPCRHGWILTFCWILDTAIQHIIPSLIWIFCRIWLQVQHFEVILSTVFASSYNTHEVNHNCLPVSSHCSTMRYQCTAITSQMSCW